MRILAATVLLSMVVLGGCAKQSVEEQIATAKTQLANEKYDEATITLKNVVVNDPSIGEARFMLGQAYFGVGAMDLAIKEFEKAIERGVTTPELMSLHLQALKQQYEIQQLLDYPTEKFEPLSAELATQYQAYVAFAQLTQNDMESAKTAVNAAADIANESIYRQLGTAYVVLKETGESVAAELVDELIAIAPDFADAHLLRGQIALSSNDLPQAISSFEAFLDIYPHNPQAKLSLITAHSRNGDFEIANTLATDLMKDFPNNPMLNQVKGVWFFENEEYQQAKQSFDKAIQGGYDNAYNRVLVGLSSLQLQQIEQAHKHFVNAQNKRPDDATILRLLAVTQSMLGRSAEATESYLALSDLSAEDATFLASNTYQLINQGNTALAKRSLDKLTEVSDKSAVQLTQQGILKLRLNEEGGLPDLREALTLAPDMAIAEQALITGELAAGENDKAVALTEEMLAADSPDAQMLNFAGGVFSQVGDLDRAKALYEQALTLDENNVQSLLLLSKVAQRQNDEKLMTELLDRVIAIAPANTTALMQRYRLALEKSEKARQQVQDRVLSALDDNDNNIPLHILAAYTHAVEGEFAKVEAVLAPIDSTQSLPGTYYMLYGDSLIYQGKREAAIPVFNRWYEKDKGSLTATFRLINALDVNENFKRAEELANKAVQRHPEEPSFKLLSAYFQLRQNQVAKAMSTLSALPVSFREAPLGKGISGISLASSGQFEQALPLLKAFHEEYDNPLSTEVLAFTYRQLGQPEKSLNVLENHLERFPNDQKILTILASLSGQSDPEQAKALYERLIDMNQKNVFALNNLAQILVKEEAYQQAANYAQLAYDLVPDNAEVADTLAYSLAKQGRFAESMRLYRVASNLPSFGEEHLLNYAEAAILAGEKETAASLLKGFNSDDANLTSRALQLREKV
ncbi:XrtA/PEP-CTERM system TPR-repeat protein PrsT [Alteromonas oceanisediminis]|uniref:XrtA/PEP-CTERM system TPR-repeat protein PrsT n=1 Tax=Alteromonas oceanisediminis TaxID=2836180 RepID=UPI001BD99094|nr:XrtA/PEP-CTERM system TPR-repeat protein PrsT [Alteromonas oceanisediminis]MBT0585686.1 PEP-CTERM system TPR-repeat protein PrsT [Alteromonas oceanisediminis]